MSLRKIIIPAALILFGLVLFLLLRGLRPDGPCQDGSAAAYWVAPMDPNYRRDRPGKSPMGMDLVPYCERQPDAAGDVQISPQVQQNLGVRSVLVERGPLQHEISAPGTVAYAEDRQQMIHTRTEGWIEKLYAHSEGDAIGKGQVLYELFAPVLVSAQSEYLGSPDNPGNPGNPGSSPLKQAARERLLALGFASSQIATLDERQTPARTLTRLAPQTGIVAMLGVREGQFVTPGTHIMTLAALDEIWVLADVLERDAAQIKPGLAATAQARARPGRVWQGQVDYVYPSLDPRTRTLRVRLRFANADRTLLPNMFVQARIGVRIADAALSIPSDALIRGARGAHVVEDLGQGSFRIAPVKIGAQTADRVEILSGLGEHSRVVIDGQFLIDAEANVDAEARRLAGPQAGLPAHSATGTSGPATAGPQGHSRAEILGINRQQIELAHEAIKPLGSQGLSMPAMQMRFALGPDVHAHDWQPGQKVRVRIEQTAPGHYRVLEISEDAAAIAPVAAPDRAMSASRESPPLNQGVVVGINPQQRQVTLDHGWIENIGMPAMVMSFALAPDIRLDQISVGDRVSFHVIEQDMNYLIVQLQATGPAE